MLNFILREMFRRADLVDMYSLADPERCKRYIVVASNALEKLFNKQKIFPKEKGGTFYFQSIDGIAKELPPDIRDQQTKNCMILSFFFIRIFQIFAALAISVIDSELPETDPTAPRPKALEKRAQARFIRPPALQGFAAPEKKSGWFSGGAAAAATQVGGELSSRSPTFVIRDPAPAAYRILNRYLVAPYAGSTSSDPMRFERMETMVIPQDTLYDGVPDARVSKAIPNPRIIYTFKSLDETATAEGKLTLTQTGDYDMTLSEVTIRIKGERKGAAGQEFKTTLSPSYTGDPDPKDRTGKTLPDALKALFEQAIESILGDRFAVIPLFYQLRYIDSYDRRAAPIRDTRLSFTNPKGNLRNKAVPFEYKDSAKVDGKQEDVTIDGILEINREKDPLGEVKYIVKVDFSKSISKPEEVKDFLEIGEYKRAVFKADSEKDEPLNDKNKTIPGYLQDEVFNKIFETLKKEGLTRGGIQYTRSGLPKPFDSPGIKDSLKVIDLWKALAKDPPVKAHCIARATQLLNVAAIKGVMKDAYSSACNVKFAYVRDKTLPTPGESITQAHGIKALAFLFIERLMSDGTPRITSSPKIQEFLRKFRSFFERVPDSVEPEAFEKIQDKAMEFCVGHWDEKIAVPGNLAGELRQKALTLINRQVSHVSAVMGLIFQLFYEPSIRAGRLEINPKILEGGIDALNGIAEQARDLLMNYYGDCEKTYTEGLNLMQSRAAELVFVGTGLANDPGEPAAAANAANDPAAP